MDTLKGALAFPIYATVAWLVWVLSQQVGREALRRPDRLVLVGLIAWAWERGRVAGQAVPGSRGAPPSQRSRPSSS